MISVGEGAPAGRDVTLSWLPVPVLTARSMGIFRVAFGAALFVVVLAHPPRAQAIELHRNYSWIADWSWLHALAASSDACRALHIATLVCAALFAIGFWTRTAYTALVAGVLVSRFVDLQRTGTHDWDLPLLTLLALMIVPWGDGFSVDARHAAERQSTAGQRYGLAIWIPGFTLGLALAAAAYAKLTTSGIGWITSGAVKYHFVEDAPNAPVAWGLWVAAHPEIAVALSLGAIVVEALFIVVSAIRAPWWRFAGGVAGLSLFAGLYVFQGVAWWPWLMLFLAFLPWTLLDGRVGVPSLQGRLRTWHVAVVALLFLQQATASITASQIEPLISDYSMYSRTYDSPETFERVRYRKMQRLLFHAGNADVTEHVSGIQNASESLLNAAEDVASGGRPQDRTMTELAGFRDEYRRLYGGDIEAVAVIAERVPFDWENGAFRPPSRVRIAEVRLPEAGTASR